MTPFLAAAAVAAAAGIPWTSDIDAAFRAATERHVPVVVDVWAVWCAPCKEMEETTYRDPRVLEAMEGSVPLKVDADTQTIFVERYAVQAYPETLFLDELGREIGRRAGYLGPDDLLAALRRLGDGYGAYRAWMGGDEGDETVVAVGGLLAGLGNRGRAAKALQPAAKRAREAPESVPEDLRAKLARALIEAGEARDGASVLARLAAEGSTRALQESSLRALAALESVRGVKELARAAKERLDREFPGSGSAAPAAPQRSSR